MNKFVNIRQRIGRWAARHQKATLLILALCAGYGFFPIGLESVSGFAFAWRVFTLLLLVFLLLSPFEKKDTDTVETDVQRQTETEDQSSLKKETDIIWQMSDEYYRKNRRDTEKDYNLFLTKLLSIIRKTFAAHTSVMYLLDSKTGELYLKCVESEEEEIVKEERHMPDTWIFQKIFENKNSFFSTDADNAHAIVPYYAEPVEILSVIAVPVYINEENEINGVLIIDSLEQNAFSEDDIPLVETYSGIIAETIMNYNNLFEFEYSTQLFSLFYEISRGLISNMKFEEILDMLLSVLRKIIHYDRLTISAYETGSNQAKIIRVEGQVDEFPEGLVFPLEEGLNGWIIRKQKPILIPDLEKDDQFIPRYTAQEKTNYNLRSFLGAPIIYHDICFGAITAESLEQNGYNERHEKILVMLANNFGVALERSYTLKQLELQATTDGLTNLYNYRFFMQRINEEIERAIRYKLKFTLLLMDIDHFKRVNDTFGHLAGDKTLTQIAASIKKSTRNVDFVCRYGGEEFVAILVETGIQEALLTAERIRRNVENLYIHYKNDTINVTISIGVVEFPNSSKDAENLINYADKALYQSKSKGRNQVVAFQEEAKSIL